MYCLKNGLLFALTFRALAMGLLICLSSSTPSLAAGNAPTTMFGEDQSIHNTKMRLDPGL